MPLFLKPRPPTRRGFFFSFSGISGAACCFPAGSRAPRASLASHLVAEGAGHALGGGLHHPVMLATTGAGATEQDAIHGIQQTAAPGRSVGKRSRHRRRA